MDNPQPHGTLDQLGRALRVSRALSEAAKVARQSRRGKPAASGGFRARRGARLLRIGMIASFFLVVLVPSIVGIAYFGFIASDQYVAEMRFSVTSAQLPKIDGLESITGLVAASVIQDTQIVVNYIGSRAAVEDISKEIDLRKIYGDQSIDLISRLDPKKPVEKLVRYWQSMYSASISLPSGFVDVKVRAYKAADALNVGNAILRSAEKLVNDLNTRANADSLRVAEQELKLASDRLAKARLAVESARNSSGFLDAAKAGDSLNALIDEKKSLLLQMQQEYSSKSRLVSTNSPQLKVLLVNIEESKKQIAQMEASLTSAKQTVAASPTISASLLQFSELQLEHQISEKLYSSAISNLEIARIAAEQQQIYLSTFVKPALPEEPQYPRRLLSILMVVGITLAGWGGAFGMLTLVRDHMA